MNEQVKAYQESNKREWCKVEQARVAYDHDHCCWAIFMYFTGPSGSQGIHPCFADEPTADACAKEIVDVFGARRMVDLVGRCCWVLRPFGYNNDQIEGIEVFGSRFTFTDWNRKLNPNAPSRLDRERSAIKVSIAEAERRLIECNEKLKTLEADYTEWAT